MSKIRSTPKTSSAYPIFHTYYLVRIPASYAYEAQHELFGTPVYDNEEQEKLAASEMVLQQRTIAEMAEFYHRGAQLILENSNDSVEIYRVIKNHLEEVQAKLRTRVNVGKVPVEDLRKLDEFATALYRVTRKHERFDTRQSNMNSKLDELFGSRFKRRQAYLEGEEREAEAQAQVREHESVADLISKEVIERNIPQRNRGD